MNVFTVALIHNIACLVAAVYLITEGHPILGFVCLMFMWSAKTDKDE